MVGFGHFEIAIRYGIHVPHVVAADDIRAVGEATRMLIIRRSQQQCRGIDRAARDHHDVGRELLGRTVLADHDTL